MSTVLFEAMGSLEGGVVSFEGVVEVMGVYGLTDNKTEPKRVYIFLFSYLLFIISMQWSILTLSIYNKLQLQLLFILFVCVVIIIIMYI